MAEASFDQSPFGNSNLVNSPTLAWYRGELRRRLSRLMMGGSEACRIAAGAGGPVAYMASSVQSPEYGTLRAMPNILPRESGETDEEFRIRRDRTTLSPFFADAVDEHVGRAFHQPPILEDSVPAFIRGQYEHTEITVDDGAADGTPQPHRITKLVEPGIAENIDAQGNHIDVFGRRVWMDAEIDGVTFVLIERTPGPRDENGVPIPQSVADRKASGGRVYWVHIQAGDVIEATPRIYNGAPRLAIWRHRERLTQADGLVIRRVRKFYDGMAKGENSDKLKPGYVPEGDPRRLARWELYEEPATLRGTPMTQDRPQVMTGTAALIESTGRAKNPDQEGWGDPIESGYLSLSFIPIVAFPFGRKIDFMQYEVANGGLAEMNGLHFRVYSDYLDLLHAACVPMLHRSGWTPSQADPSNPQTVISSKRLLYTQDASGKAEWVEVHGTSLQRIEASLDRIEARCMVLSLEPLLQRLGTPTATAEGLKAAKANSRIEMWQVLYKDALELCLDYSAQYEGLGENKGGSISTNKDLGLFLLGGVDANLLVAINAAGKIDDTTLLWELRRRSILHQDADIPEIIRLARLEQVEMLKRVQGTQLGQGIQGGLAATGQGGNVGKTEMDAAKGVPIPKGEGELLTEKAPVG